VVNRRGYGRGQTAVPHNTQESCMDVHSTTTLTWQVIEDQVTELLIIAFEAGFAAGCGQEAHIADAVSPLMAEIQRRWEERMMEPPLLADELPGWLLAQQPEVQP